MRLGDIEFSDTEVIQELGNNVDLEQVFSQSTKRAFLVESKLEKDIDDLEKEYINPFIKQFSLENKINNYKFDNCGMNWAEIINFENNLVLNDIIEMLPLNTKVRFDFTLPNGKEIKLQTGVVTGPSISNQAYYMP